MITDEMKTRAAMAAVNACHGAYGREPITSLDDLDLEAREDWLREAAAALEAVEADIRNAALEEAMSLCSHSARVLEAAQEKGQARVAFGLYDGIEDLKTQVTP